MKLYFINNYFPYLEKKIIKEKKNFFISANQIDNLNYKKYSNFFYAEKYFSNKNVIKDYKKTINCWHKDLKKIDILIQKNFSKKINFDLKNYFISSYIFRYVSFQEYCKILTIEKIINSFLKTKKIKKIIFLNKFQLSFFSEEFALSYFKNKFKKIDIRIKNSINENIEQEKKFIINEKNFKIFFHILKRKIKNNLIGKFSREKNLYLSQTKELIYSDEYNFFFANKIKLNENLKYLHPKKNLLIPKSKIIKEQFIDYIFKKSVDFTSKNLNQIFAIKKILIDQRIKKIIYDIEDNSFFSFLIIFTAKNLNLPVIGYAHGSDYTTSNRDTDHNYFCYSFCDEIRLWGKSKKFNFNRKNIYNNKISFKKYGSLSGEFLSKTMQSQKLTENILYVPSLVRSDYTNAKYIQDPSWQFKLQTQILEFFEKKSDYPVFISYPSRSLMYNYNFFPCFFLDSFKKLNPVYGSFKDNFLKIKPKKIIFDNFSTGVYEAVSTNSDILTFIDPLNQPKDDVYIELKKRAEVIKTFKNLDQKLEMFIKKKIPKNNNQFKKKFYF